MVAGNDRVILRMKQLVVFIGLSRSKIYEMLNERSKRYDPHFPKPIPLSAGAVGWYQHEVLEWLEFRRE
ncbi:helix-turn-helix transcriptional regulator [Halomonas tibetensis]|uniref:Helix-turn-helix transcriptional regulator n=1 Tax=Halomonas tibetensis TaxID=2259590 RepID=A0ABV7B902_9GAMM